MKKYNQILLSIGIIIMTSLIFWSCKKPNQNRKVNEVLNPNLTPVSNPIFNSLNEVNDHVRHLAYGLASIQDTLFMVNDNPTEYKNDLENLIPSNQDEVSFEKINNDIITPFSTIYETPLKNRYSNFSYLINGAITDQDPPYIWTSPRGWAVNTYNYNAFTGFNFQNTNYYTLLRIPEWQDINNDPNRLNKPLLVIPHEVDANGDLLLPIIGYKLNVTTQEIDTVLFQTENDMEEDVIHYFWVVDFNMVTPTSQNPSWGCLGDLAPQQNDEFCDLDCEENSANSFNDCDPANLRRVWIDEIEITEDYKQKCGPNFQWNESRLHGRYELGFQSMIVYGNGKIKKRGGRLEETWSRNQINMTKKIGLFCNFKSKGFATSKGNLSTYIWWGPQQTWGDTIEGVKSNQPKCFLAVNYKPWRDTIYFIVYEYDDPAPGRDHNISVFYRPGQSSILNYTCRNNEGPWGDKTNSNLIASFNGINPQLPTGQVYMITPKTWPGQGGKTVLSDEWTFRAIPSNSGASANTRSITVKVKYGPF